MEITKVKETYNVVYGDERCIIEYYPITCKFEIIKTRLLNESKLEEQAITCIKQNKQIEDYILNYLKYKHD